VEEHERRAGSEDALFRVCPRS